MQSLNRYAYALNNPETLVDPSGLGPVQVNFCGSLKYGVGLGMCQTEVNGVIMAEQSFGGGWAADPFDVMSIPVVTQTWIPNSQVGTMLLGASSWGPVSPGYWSTTAAGNAAQFLVMFAAPAGPNGEALPPPIALPPGKNGQPNSWRWVPGTPSRPQKWVPTYPVPSPEGGQPSASWDDEYGHWDYKNGLGDTTRFDPNGNPVNHPMSIVPIAAKTAAAAGAGSTLLEVLDSLAEAAMAF
jgi:hypothetical protein